MKNTFQIIHIIGSMQGLFLFVLLFMRKQNKLANKLLAILVLLVTIHLAVSFFHTNNNSINDYMAIGRSDIFIFLYGPLIVFYTMFLTGFEKKLRFRYLFHLGPSIILLFLLILSLVIGRYPVHFQIFEENNPYSFRFWYIIHSFALIHLLSYMIYSLIVLKKYKVKLTQYFSQSGRIRLLWLQILVFSILLTCFFAIVQFLINSFHEPEGILQWIISINIVLLIFIMGYFTNKQPDILEDLKDMNQYLADVKVLNNSILKPENKDEKLKYIKNRLDEEEERENLNKLLQYVETQKPYLEADLNLRLLSEGVGIPAHQLSMLLSIYINENFYTFINKYRIMEAKNRLEAADSMEHNILTIAFDTGFNSKSTFNTVFKKFEGITPSEYRISKQKENQPKKQ